MMILLNEGQGGGLCQKGDTDCLYWREAVVQGRTQSSKAGPTVTAAPWPFGQQNYRHIGGDRLC